MSAEMTRTSGAAIDPADWTALEAAWSRLFAAMAQHYRTLEEQPVWQPVPSAVKQRFGAPLPATGQDVDTLLARFLNDCVPYANGNLHPAFFGWLHGAGNVYGALGEACAAWLNSNLGGRDHAPIYLERQVLDWVRAWLGWGPTSGGLLTSGTSQAGLLALSVMRQWAREQALAAGSPAQPQDWVVYASEQTHHSVSKALALMGWAPEQLERLAVTADFALDAAALARQVAADRARGRQPLGVIATLGTVNTGAVDDLAAVAAFCQQQGLWLHVDAAYGMALCLTDDPRTAALGQADSVAFDFHKWFQVPYAVGCCMVRDGALQARSFGAQPDYLHEGAALAGGSPWPSGLGIELSRGFLAAKVWFTLQAIGQQPLAAMVRQHCALAQRLEQVVRADSRLSLMAPVTLNIVCLLPAGEVWNRPGPAQRARVETLVAQLQAEGVAAPSTTCLRGLWVIRVAIVNHRSRWIHLERLLERLHRLAPVLGDPRMQAWIEPPSQGLQRGGDTRLAVDPNTGLNRYGCAPRPRPEALTFASSTATSISSIAFDAVAMDRHRALQAAVDAWVSGGSTEAPGQGLAAWAQQEHRALLASLVKTFGWQLPPEALWLAPSGTDAQLYVTALLRPDAHTRVLLCAANETGRGAALAVQGCHFDDQTARAVPVQAGDPVAGIERAHFEALNAWDVPTTGQSWSGPGMAAHDCAATGSPATDQAPGTAADGRAADDQLVLERVGAWLAPEGQRIPGRRVILHAMAHSKLGLHTPSWSALRALKRTWGDALEVVVDACQLRMDPEEVNAHLGCGHWVLVSGSKFFTGVPFCGAVLMPPVWMDRLGHSPRVLPAGLHDYVASGQLPPGLSLADDPALRAAPDALEINWGLHWRWYTAQVEAQRYYAVPRVERIAALEKFSQALRARLERHARLHLVPSPPVRHDIAGQPLVPPRAELSAIQTVFAFMVRDGDGRPLDMAALKRLCHHLNRDARDLLQPLSPADRQRQCRALDLESVAALQDLAAQPCHVGQAVALPFRAAGDAATGESPPETVGALRLSIGARVISDSFSHPRGMAWALQQEQAQVDQILRKLQWLVSLNPIRGHATDGPVN